MRNLRLQTRPFAFATVALVLLAAFGYCPPAKATDDDSLTDGSSDRPPPCQPRPPIPPDPPIVVPPSPTTIDTIGQAYYCIFDNYVQGPILSDRALLLPAFAGLTQELQRRGLDQPTATPPALTGQRHRDWVAFRQVYLRITQSLPADPALAQAVAGATLQAMVDALADDHARWENTRSGGDQVGINLSIARGPVNLDPAAVPPLFVIKVTASSAAENAGVQVGDEILAINGVPPFVNGVLSKGVIAWITNPTVGEPISLLLHRPITGTTLTVNIALSNRPPPAGPGGNVVKRLNNDIAYAVLGGFAVDPVNTLLQAVRDLGSTTPLRGLILDMRGNGGGDTDAGAKLLGAFVHNATTGYWCDARHHCTANRPDDSVPLLNLPLVVLIDRRCASACDAFSSAVKDLKFGTLVGTRTAGEVSGPADSYMLDDGSAISLPKYTQLEANREIVDTIGVAPDIYVPVTSADLSAGRDLPLAKAQELLR